MATHLAPEELLADYAAGAATPGENLLIAAHLEHAPQCRAQVEAFEAVGGAVLADVDSVAMGEDALSSIFDQIDTPVADAPEPARQAVEGPLPGVVLEKLGVKFSEIQWKFQLPGVSAVDLDGFEGETVRLLRAKPGAKVPQHTHEGSELTLVLQGCLMDSGVAYMAGDVAVNDEDDDHRPEIAGDEMCYCLIVQQGSLRFTGRFSRVLNYIGE